MKNLLLAGLDILVFVKLTGEYHTHLVILFQIGHLPLLFQKKKKQNHKLSSG